MLSYKDAVTRELWMADSIHPDEEFICVSKRDGYYWIYNVLTGKPFLRIRFTDKQTATDFGMMLHKWYGEYFWIWTAKDWRDADIPSLLQYTIEKGVEIYERITKLHGQVCSNLDFFSGMV